MQSRAIFHAGLHVASPGHAFANVVQQQEQSTAIRAVPVPAKSRHNADPILTAIGSARCRLSMARNECSSTVKRW